MAANLEDTSHIARTAYGLIHGNDVADEAVVAMAEEVANAIKSETDADGVQDDWAVACTAILTIFGIDPETLVKLKLDETSQIERLMDEVAKLRSEVNQLTACEAGRVTVRSPD